MTVPASAAAAAADMNAAEDCDHIPEDDAYSGNGSDLEEYAD